MSFAAGRQDEIYDTQGITGRLVVPPNTSILKDIRMRFTVFRLPRLAAGLSLGMFLASVLSAQTPIDTLADTVAQVEQRLGTRVGVSLVDTGSELSWFYREDERF